MFPPCKNMHVFDLPPRPHGTQKTNMHAHDDGDRGGGGGANGRGFYSILQLCNAEIGVLGGPP